MTAVPPTRSADGTPPGWNDSVTEYERDTTIDEVFAQRVREYPDAIAVQDGVQELTYRELDSAAERLAEDLRTFTQGTQAAVAVLADRSAAAVIAFLAVLKAGAAYVPLDPCYPVDRLRFMLSDTGSCAIVATDAHRELAAAVSELPVVAIVANRSVPAAERETPSAPATGPRSLAYVMYTSGSSGRPKGVAIEHRGVLRYVRGARELLPYTGERVLFVNQLGFDAATYEIWAALLNGARLVVHPGQPDPHAVAATIARGEVRVAFFPAGLFHQLVEASPETLRVLGGLRLAITAGDVLSPSHARRYLREHPQGRLINAYGPTEVTVTASYHEVRDVPDGEAVPIGRPLANTTLYALDAAQRPVPAGDAGELYVGGDGVAREYLNLPELTAERFVADPFSDEPGARLYRTGDQVRLRADGALDYLGRLDDQVKIRGYRVEPAEVESTLSGHPAVRQAVVIVREEVAGHRRLVAYATTSGGTDAPALREFLRARLPDYLVPSAVVVLDDLPLTANGKVDRTALPAPAGQGEQASSETERQVVQALRTALDMQTAGLTDDFFELGGNSLLALRVLAALRDSLGISLGLEAVFAGRTAAGIARRVDEMLADPDSAGQALTSASLPPLPSGPHPEPVPASLSQTQVCFLTELAEGALPYQSQALIHLDGRLDLNALTGSLDSLLARHEILRTGFAKRGSSWLQQVNPPEPAVVEFLNLAVEDDPDAALRDYRRTVFSRRIDISSPSLIRWSLIRLARDRHVLIQIEHHLVHDGWSFTRMLGEIAQQYRYRAGRAPSPSASAEDEDEDDPSPIQFRHFARWQREFPASDAGQRQAAYWTGQLAALSPPPQLPLDHPRPLTPTFRGASLRAELDPKLALALREAAAARGSTLYMFMVTAFFALLHRYAAGGSDTGTGTDIVIGSGLANRRLPGSEPIFGMLVNTVALRADLSGDPTVTALLEQVRETCLAAYANQELPFEEVVRRVSPVRVAGQTPIYTHLFSFHDSPLPDLQLPGITLRAEDTLSNGSAKTDLNVIVISRPPRGMDPAASDPQLTVVWEYASDLFDRPTAEQMLARYLELLTQLAAEQDQPLSALRLISSAERAELAATAVSRTSYERDSAIDVVFAHRVAEDPGAIAVIHRDGDLSYAELDAAADRVADRLRAARLPAGTRVGVLDDRTPAMLAALVGVLRANCSYVGIDPALPSARLDTIVTAAGIPLICAGSPRWREGELPVPVLDCGSLLTADTDAPDGSSVLDAAARSDRPVDPDVPAYVCFTSGSTGEPKGVEITHRGVLRLVRGADYVELGPDERVLAAAPLSFDASTFELWGALLNGASVVLAPAGALSAAERADLLVSKRISVAWFTAGIFHQLVDHELGALAGVRQVIAGGDVLSPGHVNQVLRALPAGGVLINGYGPTEGTTFSCCHRMQAGDEVTDTVPIGRPIANTYVRVLDASGEPVPPGMVGELWIGGDGLAKGYLGLPEETAARFRPDPFSTVPTDRLYRTGDLVRQRWDGALEFHGRADRQVKIRGYRVEPGEAEAALVRLPGVRQAYVTAQRFGRDDTRLVAYLISSTGAGSAAPGTGAAELRAQLAAELPDYLVPAAFIWLDGFPLGASGKVDAARLPAPESSWFADGDGRTPVTPASTLVKPVRGASRLEQTMVAIWQEVTGVREIGLDDNFFDLGGHSLLAVELFAAIERSTGARLPLSAIFEAPTVRALAAVLRSEGWDAPWGSLIGLRTTGSRPPLFAVTAGDGNVVGFGPLSRRLRPDQPCYVLQPHGLDGRAPLHRSVEAMAAHYVKQIRTVQPTGPYLLGGRCFGTLVAYEMTRQLESAGQRVALLIAIDSVGPLWQSRTLANGVPYDEVMNLARVHAAAESDAPATLSEDIFTDPDTAAGFLAWLQEPVSAHDGHTVSRYLYAAYLVRADLRAAYPLTDGGHAGLIHWSWVGGRSELGMNPDLLPVPSADARRARPSTDPRQRRLGHRVRAAMLDGTDFLTRGALPVLAQRRRARVLEIATQNVLSYRGGPCAAPVMVIRSRDDEDDLQLARWQGLLTGGVELHYVPGTHHGMLREPDVASLARVIEHGIDRALPQAGRPLR